MRRHLVVLSLALFAACGTTPSTTNPDGECTTAKDGTACTGGKCCQKVCVQSGTKSVCTSNTNKTCNDCTAPEHGLASCDNGTCNLSCANGYHLCGTVCADDTAVETCGSACSPCAQRAHASASCESNACAYDCNAGWTDANGDATDGCERIQLAGTVADYPLDGNAKDVSGHGEDGTLHGTSPTRDRFQRDGGALHFVASNKDWVDVANDVSLPLGPAPRTVTFWFRLTLGQPGTSGYQDFFNWGSYSDGKRFGVSSRVDNYKIFFTGQNADYVTNFDSESDAQWHFVTTTYNGSSVAMTVDGTSQGSGSVTLNTVGNDLRLGHKVDGGADEFLSGDLDDVRIFNRVLDGGELMRLFHENPDGGTF